MWRGLRQFQVKRFTETSKWDDPWFLGLSLDAKLAFWYMTEKCDGAGVWEPNKRLANFCFTRDLDWDAILSEMGDRVVVLPGGKWHLTKFVDFQYGALSVDCKPHLSVIRLQEKHGLKGYTKGMNTLKEKDKEQEKEKDKERRRVFEPPTPTEVEGYAKGIGYELDGASWCDSYAQKGWLVGRSKMRDWRAAVRNWKANGWRTGGNGSDGRTRAATPAEHLANPWGDPI